MMEKFSVITRYLICIICIFLFFGGCDRSASTPARPKVVRKKIAVPQKKTVTVRKSRTARVAKVTPSAGGQRTVNPQKQLRTVKTRQTTNGSKSVLAPKSKMAMPAGTKTASSREKNSKPAPASKKTSPVTPPVATKTQSASSGVKTRTVPPKVSADKSLALAPKGILKLSSDGSPQAYDPTGKIDPFEPLFQEKVVVSKKNRRKKRLPRTPLERISLSQLKLVGIILAASGNRALVEESTGKGYIIRKGTYVGTNAGKVVQINKYKVIVEEEFDDVFGKTKTRQKALKLPKPPGEF